MQCLLTLEVSYSCDSLLVTKSALFSAGGDYNAYKYQELGSLGIVYHGPLRVKVNHTIRNHGDLYRLLAIPGSPTERSELCILVQSYVSPMEEVSSSRFHSKSLEILKCIFHTKENDRNGA